MAYQPNPRFQVHLHHPAQLEAVLDRLQGCHAQPRLPRAFFLFALARPQRDHVGQSGSGSGLLWQIVSYVVPGCTQPWAENSAAGTFVEC